MTAPDHRRIRSKDLLHRRGHPHMTHWCVLASRESLWLPAAGQIDSRRRKSALASILAAKLRHGPRDPETSCRGCRAARSTRTKPRLDRQHKAVAALERADQDATKAKRFLKILEKALAVHIADRDRLTTRRARITR